MKKTIFPVIIIALSLLLMTSCHKKASSADEDITSLGYDFTPLMDQSEEEVLNKLNEADIAYAKIEQDTESEDSSYQMQETIEGLPFTTEFAFYQGALVGCQRTFYVETLSDENRAALNRLYRQTVQLYGEPTPFEGNMILLQDGTAEPIDDLAEGNLKDAYEDGTLFNLDVDTLQMYWRTTEGGIRIFRYMYGEELGESLNGSHVYLYELSPEATKRNGYSGFVDPEE